MLKATAIRAPQPPFPAGSWFVCLGDPGGTMLELMPWGAVRDIDVPNSLNHDADMRGRSGAHILIGTPLAAGEIMALASKAGWKAEPGSAGLFRFVKVWVENHFLIEFLPPDMAPEYAANFNAQGLATLDAKLREVEAMLAAKAG